MARRSLVEIYLPQRVFVFSIQCVTQRSRLGVLLHFADNTYNFGAGKDAYCEKPMGNVLEEVKGARCRSCAESHHSDWHAASKRQNSAPNGSDGYIILPVKLSLLHLVGKMPSKNSVRCVSRFIGVFVVLSFLALTGQAQSQPIRVIAFGAHPDDCDLGAGGLAAKYAARGDKVKFVSLKQRRRGPPVIAWRGTCQAEACGSTRSRAAHRHRIRSSRQPRWQALTDS